MFLELSLPGHGCWIHYYYIFLKKTDVLYYLRLESRPKDYRNIDTNHAGTGEAYTC